MATGLPKFNPTEDGNESDGTPDAPPDPTLGADAITNGNQEDEKEKEKKSNNSAVPPPPPVAIKQSSSTHSSTSAIVRVQTPPSSYGGTRSPHSQTRFGGSVGGLPKPNTQTFQERMEKASLDSSMNHEAIRQSSNPLALGGSNSSYHSSQGSGHGQGALLSPMSPLDDVKDEALESVEFTALLRQVDIGLEMTELLKEVIRKFSKHQNADATKLQEIYGKMKNVYSEMDGMREFAEVCNLAHKLILETVQQQKVLAEFLGNELVPKLTTHLQEKQAAVQILKKENQQAELKLQTSITAMNKAENNFKKAAKHARQAADPTPRKKTGQKPNVTMFVKKFKEKTKASKDMSEEEELYIKADTLASTYEASVMTANHAQEKHTQICRHFKYRLRAIEESRMSYCTQQVQLMMKKHKEMFESKEIDKLRLEVITKAGELDSSSNFDKWVSRSTQLHHHSSTSSKSKLNKQMGEKKFVAKSYDYENALYSLEDAMKVTRKLLALKQEDPKNVKIPNNCVAIATTNGNVPLMMSVLCEKVKECNGFTEEGIFRVSAAKSDLENLQRRLFNHNYEINTNNAHLPAHMLKEWLRHLKDSIIPSTYYDICIDMAKKGNIDADRLDVFISQLPETNRDSIRYLVGFIKELLKPENTKKSKMNAKNVAIVFAPNILRCPSDDANTLLTNAEHEQAFFMQLVEKLKI